MVILKRMLLFILGLIGFGIVVNLVLHNHHNTNNSKLNIPLAVDGTTLTIEKICNASDLGFEVQKCAAMIILNYGEYIAEAISVKIETEDGAYLFETTMLPAGERMVLFENNFRQWEQQDVLSCIGSMKARSALYDIYDFEIVQRDRGEVMLINTSDVPIGYLILYQKPWSEELNMYYGNTFIYSVRCLAPGDSMVIYHDTDYARTVFAEKTAYPTKRVCGINLIHKTLERKSFSLGCCGFVKI